MVPDDGEDDASIQCGGDCCPLVSVGIDDYVFSQYLPDKPEEVCSNGCIYTRLGDTSSDQYCFKQGDAVENNVQCKADLTLPTPTPSPVLPACCPSISVSIAGSDLNGRYHLVDSKP